MIVEKEFSLLLVWKKNSKPFSLPWKLENVFWVNGQFEVEHFFFTEAKHQGSAVLALFFHFFVSFYTFPEWRDRAKMTFLSIFHAKLRKLLWKWATVPRNSTLKNALFQTKNHFFNFAELQAPLSKHRKKKKTHCVSKVSNCNSFLLSTFQLLKNGFRWRIETCNQSSYSFHFNIWKKI